MPQPPPGPEEKSEEEKKSEEENRRKRRASRRRVETFKEVCGALRNCRGETGDDAREPGQPGTGRVMAFMGGPAVLALIVFAIADGPLAVAMLTAVASFAVGTLLGFLFGIPRTVDSQQAAAAGAAGAAAAAGDGQAAAEAANAAVAAAQPGTSFAPNTNLEQISDWLTKILVGVGLVQLGQISGGVNNLADGIAPALGKHGHAVAIALMVSFAIIGFLTGYLYTRLRLQMAFSFATIFRQAQKQADTGNTSLALVRSQLDPGGDSTVSLAELTEALRAAPRATRSQAFYLAREQRRRNWRGQEGERQLVNLTVPIFEALIAIDRKEQFHRNFGELGYALKDKENPDYLQARENLSKAIEIRGPAGVAKFPLYEFCRAYCNVKLDPEFPQERPAAPELAATIHKDLAKSAATSAGSAAIEASKDDVGRWLELNPQQQPPDPPEPAAQ